MFQNVSYLDHLVLLFFFWLIQTWHKPVDFRLWIMISLPESLVDFSCQRQASSESGAGLNSETDLLIRTDLWFSAEIPTAILSSAWSEQYSKTLGHGSEHEGFAKTCF